MDIYETALWSFVLMTVIGCVMVQVMAIAGIILQCVGLIGLGATVIIAGTRGRCWGRK